MAEEIDFFETVESRSFCLRKKRRTELRRLDVANEQGSRLYLDDSSGVEGQSRLFVKSSGYFGKLGSVLPLLADVYARDKRL